jgi:hypothetical protein
VLAVVEQQQRTPRPQRANDGRQPVVALRLAHAEHVAHRLVQQRRVSERAQIDHPGTVSEGVAHLRREAQREARLSHPAGPDERQQPPLGQESSKPGQFALAPNKGIDFARQIADCREVPWLPGRR